MASSKLAAPRMLSARASAFIWPIASASTLRKRAAAASFVEAPFGAVPVIPAVRRLIWAVVRLVILLSYLGRRLSLPSYWLRPGLAGPGHALGADQAAARSRRVAIRASAAARSSAISIVP